MKKRSAKTVITIKIEDAPNLTKQGRKAVAAWLREQAEFVERRGPEMASHCLLRHTHWSDAP